MGSRSLESMNTIFNIDDVPQAPEDSHYGLKSKYLADKTVDKLDLIIGAYRDGDGKPWVLPVVKKVGVHNASSTSHPMHINYSFLLSRQTIFSILTRIGTMNIFLFPGYQVLPPPPKSLYLAPTPAPSGKAEFVSYPYSPLHTVTDDTRYVHFRPFPVRELYISAVSSFRTSYVDRSLRFTSPHPAGTITLGYLTMFNCQSEHILTIQKKRTVSTSMV
jgi:hypothetical protein